MSDNSLTVHHTVTNRIETESGTGWEFCCHACSYRARYVNAPGDGSLHLVIMEIGDPDARHTSGSGSNLIDDTWTPEAIEEALLVEDEAWLTPEILDVIDRIVSRLDE